MIVSKVKSLSALDMLIYWIKERHKIFLLKEQGYDSPWTNDEILQTIYFTNPYRENDKTTRWYRQNIGISSSDDPKMIFATACFRWFNLISTGKALIKEGLLVNWDSDKAIKLMNSLRENGSQVFTSAFNISNSDPKKTKLDGVCRDYIKSVWDKRNRLEVALPNSSLGTAFSILSECKGYGGSGFMNAQVICDLKYTRLLNKAKDWDTWCSPGPGSMKGLNIILDKPETTKYNINKFQEEINKIRPTINKRIGNMEPLHAQDLQNCLCEFFKYTRVLNGGGTRRRYNGSYNHK